MQELVRQLLAAGYSQAEIPGIIRDLAAAVERKKQELAASGYPAIYINSLSPQELFKTAGLPVVTGQNEIDRDLQARIAAETALGNRATTATGLLDRFQTEEEARRQREQSPFTLARHLIDLQQTQGGNPIQQLIGEGKYIDPILPTMQEDPDYQRVRQSAIDYAAPATFQTERRTDPNIARVRDAYARDPGAADRYFRLMEAERRRLAGVPGAADGGQMLTDEPIIGMGMRTRRPRFMVGEEAPELLEITPIPRYAHGGRVNVNVPDNPYGEEIPGLTSSKPGTSQKGLDQYNRSGGKGGGSSLDLAYRMRAGTRLGGAGSLGRGGDRAIAQRQSLFNAPAPGGQTPAPAQPGAPVEPPLPNGVTPRAAAAIALGRAVQNNPFAHPDMVRALLAGQLPPPGSVTQRFLNNIHPTIRDAVLSLSEPFGTLARDYASSIDQFGVQGINLYG